MVSQMRRRLRFILMGLTLCGSGCTLVCDASTLGIHTLRETATDFGESVRNRKLAQSAWKEVQRASPEKPYSNDYANGFKDGFANYLFRGGNGEPPPLPPAHYRKLRYQTPQGYQAIEDWFAGYRHGAVAARQNGYRQWITGPSGLGGTGPLLPLSEPGPNPPKFGGSPPLEMAPPPAPASPGAQRQRPGAPLTSTVPAPLPAIFNGVSRPVPPAG
jgi:hypothetical protein